MRSAWSRMKALKQDTHNNTHLKEKVQQTESSVITLAQLPGSRASD